MNGQNDTPDRAGICRACRDQFQEYLDGTLPKARSLELFLHLRECAPCQEQLDQTRRLFSLLDGLPAVEVPEDFNENVLCAVPYQAYKEMAPLRRERIPVFLEEEYLPEWLRALPTRVGGLLTAAITASGLAASLLPDGLALVVALGILPEGMIRLQGVARRFALAVRRSEGS